MPVKRRPVGNSDVGPFRALADELANELSRPKLFGQPLVDEETFTRTGLLGITVMWDKWENVPEIKRPSVILNAYERARGTEEKNRIAFAIGLSVAEAVDEGRLPFSIVPHLRRTDPFTADQVRALLREFGGTVLASDSTSTPTLFFGSSGGSALRVLKR